ncbi:MAG: hypothetical protein C4308_07925 [Chitinophagaceae bacterium]
MFTQTWRKYLPVIKLFLKRSQKADQVVEMNSTDFLKAAGGKKVKFTFSFKLTHGKILHVETAPAIGRELVDVMLEEKQTEEFLKKSIVEFTLKNNFQLGIKNLTPAEEIPVEKTIKNNDSLPAEEKVVETTEESKADETTG